MADRTYPVTRRNCTVDGSGYGWRGLDMTQAELREHASIMVYLLGSNAPPDHHLRVPRPAEETYHRVRPKREDDRFVHVNGEWRIRYGFSVPESGFTGGEDG